MAAEVYIVNCSYSIATSSRKPCPHDAQLTIDFTALKFQRNFKSTLSIAFGKASIPFALRSTDHRSKTCLCPSFEIFETDIASYVSYATFICKVLISFLRPFEVILLNGNRISHFYSGSFERCL